MTPFGLKLRALRESRGLMLKDMAAALDLSAAYLSALEHGQRGKPGPGLVMEICGHLDLIWDEAEELKRLADLSHPKVTLDTSKLSPLATEVANTFKQRLPHLSDDTLKQMLVTLHAEGSAE